MLLILLPLALAQARLRLDPVELGAVVSPPGLAEATVRFDALTELPQRGWSFSVALGDTPVDRCTAVVKTADAVAADRSYAGELVLRGCHEALPRALRATPGAALRLVPGGTAWSEYTVDLTTAEDAAEVSVTAEGAGWVVAVPPGSRGVALYEAGNWAAGRPGADGLVRFDKSAVDRLQPVGSSGKVWVYLQPAAGAPQSRRVATPVSAPLLALDASPVEALCEAPADPAAVFVKVDARHAWSTQLTVRPGTPIEVCVVHPSDWAPEITMGGTRGFSDPVVRELAEAQAGGPGAVTWRATRAMFAPRLPGAADLTVQSRDASRAIVARIVVEITVETVYAGALRVGLGLGWAPYQRDYEAVVVPGSTQAEVANVLEDEALPGAELVLGYAIFLDRGGRGYEAEHDRARTRPLVGRLAPYLGIGLLDADDTDALDVLKTVYLGAEWEINPSASLALAGLVRRTERLDPGFLVGGPAGTATSDDLVSPVYRPGVGLVLNVSPAFFRTVRGGLTP